MTNKTIVNKVVIREPGLQKHKEGYSRVIMRESGPGREFVELLEGSKKLKLQFWESKANLITYYVDKHPQLRFKPEPSLCTHSSGIDGHSFTLKFNLRYTVRDPKSLVEKLDRDPLSEIEREIKDLLPEPIIKLPWEEVLNNNTNFTAVGLGTNNKDDNGNETENNKIILYQIAWRMGIEILDLKINRNLSERALRLANKIEEENEKIAMQESERQRLAQEHGNKMVDQDRENELKAQEAYRKTQIRLYDTLIQSVEGALERNLDQTRSIPEINRIIRELKGLMEHQIAFSKSDASHAENLEALPDKTETNDPEEILAFGKISDLVHRIEYGITSLQEMIGNKDLLAAALHVIAEAQLDSGKKNKMDSYLTDLKTIWLTQAQQFPIRDIEFFNNLIAYYEDEFGL